MSNAEHVEDKIIIDMPMSPQEDLERTLSAHSLSDPSVEVLRVDQIKENIPPQPPMECESHFDSDENQPILRQGSSFDSLEMNTSPPRLFSSPITNRKRKQYVGDLDVNDFATPEKAEKSLSLLKCHIFGLRRHLRVWRQKCRRYKVKIKNLEALLQHYNIQHP
ncbi:uncharacterized protein LOC117641019 [Thrips palmi]|uniref:Uncharacterized protein LOC117641019 n=1 Tax=Thrips palmi TaxID=161013 RepID=A0A6P8Y3D0_THRPL|nr:uncharacterized protein LOC117641019 [Thrips palmi]